MTASREWLLERVALGEGPPDFEPDPAALVALRASNDAILADLPPRAVVAEIERRAGAAKPRSRAPLFAFATALAGAAALLLFFALGRAGAPASDVDEAELDSGIRIKGDPRLIVHVKRDGGAALLAPGEKARAGDLLQLSYIAAGRRHGVIVSIDGRGAVTLHFPETVSGSTALSGGGATALTSAYRLDDAPEFERFFFVSSHLPIDPAAVINAAEKVAAGQRRDSAPLELPANSEQASFMVKKAETP